MGSQRVGHDSDFTLTFTFIGPSAGCACQWPLERVIPRKKSETALKHTWGCMGGASGCLSACLMCDLRAEELQDQRGHVPLAFWIPYPGQQEEVPLKSTTQDRSLRVAHCSFPLPSGSHNRFTFLVIHMQGSVWGKHVSKLFYSVQGSFSLLVSLPFTCHERAPVHTHSLFVTILTGFPFLWISNSILPPPLQFLKYTRFHLFSMFF